ERVGETDEKRGPAGWEEARAEPNHRHPHVTRAESRDGKRGQGGQLEGAGEDLSLELNRGADQGRPHEPAYRTAPPRRPSLSPCAPPRPSSYCPPRCPSP